MRPSEKYVKLGHGSAGLCGQGLRLFANLHLLHCLAYNIIPQQCALIVSNVNKTGATVNSPFKILLAKFRCHPWIFKTQQKGGYRVIATLSLNPPRSESRSSSLCGQVWTSWQSLWSIHNRISFWTETNQVIWKMYIKTKRNWNIFLVRSNEVTRPDFDAD